MCAGIVKAHGLNPKKPPQHAADFKMLGGMREQSPAFTNTETSKRKSVTCVRVDGSSDEGPSHVEVQFWWTE